MYDDDDVTFTSPKSVRCISVYDDVTYVYVYDDDDVTLHHQSPCVVFIHKRKNKQMDKQINEYMNK